MWIFLFSRIVMCLVIGQLFTFCVLVVRGAYWQAFLTIAFMPALTGRFYKCVWQNAPLFVLLCEELACFGVSTSSCAYGMRRQ